MTTDVSTAILECKIKNSLRVTPGTKLNSYEISINPETAEELDLFQDAPVKVMGKKQKVNYLIVVFSDEVEKGAVGISKDTRTNLRVKLNDYVKLYDEGTTEMPVIDSVAFYQIVDDENPNIVGNVFEAYVQPFFNRHKLYLSVGNIYRIKSGAMSTIDFKVVSMVDKDGVEIEHGIAVDDTNVECGQTVQRSEVDKEINLIGYDDIGGCRRQMAQIRELIELPLKQPGLFKKIGIKPPRGILMHGPPGTGKTLIARAIANETGAYLHIINGPEIMSKMSGESESNLRKAFEEAEKHSPAIIFMDEIDSVAPNRENTHGEVEKRIVSQLLTLMDGIKSLSNVLVLAATNRPNSIDPALRRFGRFDREIEIGVPDDVGRLEVLSIHTKNMNLDPDVDLEAIAKEIHGFTGSDIASLCTEAALQQIREKLPYIDLDRDDIDAEILASLRVNRENFEYAIRNTDPSSLRETVIQSPNVPWESIGGLEGVKRELRETIQYPVNYPEKYLKFGQNPSKGVLLYGPPGCGKTLLAKAVATECNANFISVKGPELLNKYVGESESNVRHLYDKARGSAPCVLFFDEIDSLGRSRSGSFDSSGVGANVLNQMLAEMDGMNQKKNVFVIGATNMPGSLDSALMRPGRLDQLVYIPLPDVNSRRSILRAKLRNAPVAEDVDLDLIAKVTEGFSGADLSEICQRAAKLAIRECIEYEKKYEMKNNSGKTGENNISEDFVDPVPALTALHFKEAMKTARKSVTQKEIDGFEAFARSMNVQLTNDTTNTEYNQDEDDLYN